MPGLYIADSWLNHLYEIPLAFSITLLATMTLAFAVVMLIYMKKMVSASNNIEKALGNIANELSRNTCALNKNTSELGEELKVGRDNTTKLMTEMEKIRSATDSVYKSIKKMCWWT